MVVGPVHDFVLFLKCPLKVQKQGGLKKLPTPDSYRHTSFETLISIPSF